VASIDVPFQETPAAKSRQGASRFLMLTFVDVCRSNTYIHTYLHIVIIVHDYYYYYHYYYYYE
jgi:hypothetical protein